MDVLAGALANAAPEVSAEYAEFVEFALPHAGQAQKLWRHLMPIRPVFPDGNTLIAETYREGRAKASAEKVLRVLERHSVPGVDDIRDQVLTCTDLETLDRWFERAFDVGQAREIFD